jgi:hypothetical protein
MRVRGSLATLSLIVCALVGCAAPGADPASTSGQAQAFGADDPAGTEATEATEATEPEGTEGTDGPAPQPDGEVPEEQDDREPLAISIDAVDYVHGALRMVATMEDGAADVTVRLADCDHRHVGGGVSTLSTLVWSLGDKDLADAITCALHVRARSREGTQYVSKVVDLGVGVDVSAPEGENPEDGPIIQSATATQGGEVLTFTQVSPGAHLVTSDSILEADPSDTDAGEPSADDDAGTPAPTQYTVPLVDIARSALEGRRLRLDGASFVTTLSIAGTTLAPAAGPAVDSQEEPGMTVEEGQGESEQEETGQEDTAQEDIGQEENGPDEVEPEPNLATR